MEVLSPRSTNVPSKASTDMKKLKVERKPAPVEKPQNPDRIDDKWRPPVTVTEPGATPETFITGRKLGKGGFAVCFEGRTKSTAEVFALKVVKQKVEQKKMMEKFRTELQIHAKMDHPYIVQFLRAFTFNEHTYVVLELCSNGNLTDMVKARSCLSLPEVRRFMVQICGGVKYMHKRSVIHRDLKMGNIFLDSQMNIKIGDFGLAAVMADEQDRRTTLCGTPNYIAPEILSKSGTRGHDNKVDTWAIGVICYAMLVGTPPFQSKTQQEIYAKLRTLEYEWKIDCKNYIPHQAKDFVAACLNLDSVARPEMDDLVEYEFFTMGAIADTLDNSCLKQKPEWLQNADPRGDKVRTGYGITHTRACRTAGVGRAADGRPRPSVGEKADVSTLMEIEAENRQGSAPVIPLPEGILYTAFSKAHAEWVLHQKHPLLPNPKSRKPLIESQTQNNMDGTVESQAIVNLAATERMPPPPPRANRNVPSFAAQMRQQALPQRTVQKPLVEAQLATDPPSVENLPPNEGLLRARPVRAASVRTTRKTVATKDENNAVKTLPKSTTLPLALRRTADASTPTESDIEPVPRPASRTRVASTRQHRATSTVATSQAKTSRRIISSRVTSPDAIPENMLQPTSGNDRQPVMAEKEAVVSTVRPLSERTRSDSSSSLSKKNAPIIATTDPYVDVPRTSPSDILSDLQDLHDVLGKRRSVEMTGTTTRPNTRRLKARLPYPRVNMWVDYANKHGIAYILNDGSLGMVTRSSDDNNKPSGCTVIRNGWSHSVNRARGVEMQIVPQGKYAQDVEFVVRDHVDDEMKKLSVAAKKFQLDLKTHASQIEAAVALQKGLEGSEYQRSKEVILLDKFGKHMNARYKGEEEEVQNEATIAPTEHFICFYQRVGNVGVWRYGDGGMQFNFPDHTKVTLYQDRSGRSMEHVVDVVYLEPAHAINLQQRGRVTSEELEKRGTMTITLLDIISGRLQALEADVVKTNEIREKLSWIRAVIGCWIKEGGVGRMGEEKLGWSGLQEKKDDKTGAPRGKLSWVTVGRHGGDGPPGETIH